MHPCNDVAQTAGNGILPSDIQTKLPRSSISCFMWNPLPSLKFQQIPKSLYPWLCLASSLCTNVFSNSFTFHYLLPLVSFYSILIHIPNKFLPLISTKKQLHKAQRCTLQKWKNLKMNNSYPCVIANFMSTWLDQGMDTRYLVRHYFWVCLWEGFWVTFHLNQWTQ